MKMMKNMISWIYYLFRLLSGFLKFNFIIEYFMFCVVMDVWEFDDLSNLLCKVLVVIVFFGLVCCNFEEF